MLAVYIASINLLCEDCCSQNDFQKCGICSVNSIVMAVYIILYTMHETIELLMIKLFMSDVVQDFLPDDLPEAAGDLPRGDCFPFLLEGGLEPGWGSACTARLSTLTPTLPSCWDIS